MALWTFGDSFSVAPSKDLANVPNWPLWHEIVARNLNFDSYRCHAQWGVSNEYILEQFLTYQMEYVTGDCIIIQLTNSSRQWFVKDQPEISNFYIKDLEQWFTKEQVKAVEMYIEHLQRDDMDELRYFILVKALERLTQELEDCKILILPGFHPIPGINGTLTDICNNEFVSDQTRSDWYEKHGVDIRFNHLSQDNHVILAARVTDFFQTGKLVDLQDGYKQGFL